MPHGDCYLWRPEVLWLNVVSDALIALAYFSIPLALVYLVRKRRDLPFPWLFWLFGLFMVACGTTHILAVVTIWWPVYRFDGLVKAITALASMATVAALLPIIPKALGLESPAKLLAANLLLEQEIEARKEAEAKLAAVNQEMETKVRERTAELAQTVDRLRESDSRLHTVLDAAPVVLFATDAAGIFNFSEGKGLTEIGLTPGERVGQSLLDLHAERPVILDSFRRALAGESVQLETPVADLTMDLRLSPTRERDGTIVGVTGIGVDVTSARRAREHLLEVKEEAERANNAKSEFLSRMSHELRTPLNAVLGFAQLLELGAKTPQDAASVQQILKAGRHLLALIDEVLDITRIETGKLYLNLEPLAVRATLEAAIKLLEPMAMSRQIRMEFAECPTDLHVLADKLRYHQALLNLLSNAVKFNRDAGSVRVSCERRGAQVRIMVTDTGYGVSAADLTKLFSPFERLDANERNIDGTGIGLALSKRLIESQGGQIGVESTVGVGSTFWIQLPYTEGPGTGNTAVPATASPDLTAANPKRSTVLYIEDDLSNYTLVESIFERYPQVHLIVAMQGVLGLEMARQHRPDLILLDLHLPDITGDEVLRRLHADAQLRDTPVVMISANATPPQVDRLLTAGVREYLIKPLDVRKFVSVVDHVLGTGKPDPGGAGI